MTTIVSNRIRAGLRARGYKKADSGIRVFRDVYAGVRDVLDPVVDDAADAAAVHMDSVSSRTLNGISIDDGRSARGGTGQVNSVPPTSEREPLDSDFLAADEDRVSC